MKFHNVLKLVFIGAAFLFLFVFATYPKTDCQVCEFGYEGKVLDGYEAFDLVEAGCLSYNKPWDTPEFNVTLNETFK